MVDLWGTILAPQPWTETHLKFYYQLQGQRSTNRSRKALGPRPGEQRLRATRSVTFTSDHGDLQGSHNGMHEKVGLRLRGGTACPVRRVRSAAARRRCELDAPMSHADLIPTLLGLAGIDPDGELLPRCERNTRRHAR